MRTSMVTSVSWVRGPVKASLQSLDSATRPKASLCDPKPAAVRTRPLALPSRLHRCYACLPIVFTDRNLRRGDYEIG